MLTRVAFTLFHRVHYLLIQMNDFSMFLSSSRINCVFTILRAKLTQHNKVFVSRSNFFYGNIITFYSYPVHIWFKGQIKVTEIVLKLNSKKLYFKRVVFFLSLDCFIRKVLLFCNKQKLWDKLPTWKMSHCAWVFSR